MKETFSVENMSLNYFVSISKEQLPKLVFFHGLSSSGSAMIPLLSQLITKFTIYLPDARGHGASVPCPRNTFTRDYLISDAVAFLKFVSDDIPVFAVGHSMGAATLAEASKICPEIIKALILEDPPWIRMPGDPVDKSIFVPLPLDACKKLQTLTVEEFELQNNAFKANLDDSLAKTHLEAMRSLDLNGIEPTFTETNENLFNVATTHIIVPVLIQSGSNSHGSLLRPWVSKKVLETCVIGKEENFPEAHHVIHEKFQERWIRSVLEFLHSFTD